MATSHAIWLMAVSILTQRLYQIFELNCFQALPQLQIRESTMRIQILSNGATEQDAVFLRNNR